AVHEVERADFAGRRVHARRRPEQIDQPFMHSPAPCPSLELIAAIVKIGSTRLWRSAILRLQEYVMPSTRMETRAGWINGRQRDIVEAVQRALVEGIAIPENDRCVRLLEYPEHSFIAPPDRGPAYSIIEIT